MVCIQICSAREWSSLKELLKDKECEIEAYIETYPFGEFIRINYCKRNCIFYFSGISKTRSSAACQYAIDYWKPSIIIVLGTCGGVCEKLHTLDVIIADKTVQYDCIVRVGGESTLFYEPFTTEIDNSWIDFTKFKEPVHSGLIATADQDMTGDLLDELREENVMCADWESGAISFICKVNNIKCCVARGITDVPNKNDANTEVSQSLDFRKNAPIVMEKLVKTILPILLESLQ